jgi:hypothetical protein
MKVPKNGKAHIFLLFTITALYSYYFMDQTAAKQQNSSGHILLSALQKKFLAT